MQHTISQEHDLVTKLTRVFLFCGVIAGPFFLIVGLAQALTRPGFDITRHDLSLLSNGDLGWIQVTNFIVSGLLFVAGAVGMRQALRGGRGGIWVPVLLGIHGLGTIGAGFFAADPAFGFPPGTAASANTISWHGLLHFLCGGIGFLALMAACFVMGRRFALQKSREWAAYSVASGVFFFAAFIGIATGSGQPASVIGFLIGIIVGWAWISVIATQFFVGTTPAFASTEKSTGKSRY
jgi:hypothetical protein